MRKEDHHDHDYDVDYWVNASRMKQDWGNMNGSGTTTG